MKFITRRPSHDDLARPSTYAEQVLHVTDTAMADPKSPYCGNGGLLLRMWHTIDLDPRTIHYTHICGGCRRRLVKEGIDVGFLR